MGLKQYLLEELRSSNELSLRTINEICNGRNPEQKFYKPSCAERRLRELVNEFKEIEPLMKGNYIAAYIWKGELKQNRLI